MIAKIASPYPETVGIAVHYGFYLNEVQFYRECSTTPGLRVPAAYYSDIDEAGSVVRAAARGPRPSARMADQVVGCPPGRCRARDGRRRRAPLVLVGEPEARRPVTGCGPSNNDAYKSAQEQYAAVWPGFVERFASTGAARRRSPSREAYQTAHRRRCFDWVDREPADHRSPTPTSGSTTSSSTTPTARR